MSSMATGLRARLPVSQQQAHSTDSQSNDTDSQSCSFRISTGLPACQIHTATNTDTCFLRKQSQQSKFSYVWQVLEELAITVQAQLGDRLPLPFCAFNGGADVFVDLGNKSLGLEVRALSAS